MKMQIVKRTVEIMPKLSFVFKKEEIDILIKIKNGGVHWSMALYIGFESFLKYLIGDVTRTSEYP